MPFLTWGGRVGCLHCPPVSPNGHLLAGEINSGKFGIYLDSQWKPKAGDHQFEETYISELLPLEYTQMNKFMKMRILWEFLVQKCQLFEIHVLPLLQEVRPNVLLASLSHLNVTLKQEYYLNSQTPSKAEIFCHFCSIRISQRKHSGSHFQILQNICLM